MPGIDDDRMIQTFATNASDQPLRVAILPRTSRRTQNLLDVHSINSYPETFAVDSVAISNQIPRSTVFRKRFNDLVCCPNSGWMLGDIKVNDSQGNPCGADGNLRQEY